MKYIEALQIGFPGVHCYSAGELDRYEDLVWESGNPLPSKETLDSWILSNPQAPVSDFKITILAFRNRFTTAEKIATEMASLDDPAATLAGRQLAATIRVILRDTESATFIDLARADTRQGVMLLEQVGIIAAGRGTIILDSPIQSVERPIFLGMFS
jgi:hypothetical protein